MTGYIFDIKQFAVHDGPGIRTTVFLKGCPMDCLWCHNPESRLSEPQQVTLTRGPSINKTRTIGSSVTPKQIIDRILKDEIFYDESNGGVTFSGGEPMHQIEFLETVLKLCRQHNLNTAVDTCGYAPWENYNRIYKLTNLFLYDLKPMDDKAHTELTGVSNQLIHDNLKKLSALHNNIVIRIPLIPEFTTSLENIIKIISMLKSLPTIHRIDLLPFNNLGNDKIERYNLDREQLERPTLSTEKINQVKEQLAAANFDVRIGT